jgi:Flp pilus assembly pilin Flp
MNRTPLDHLDRLGIPAVSYLAAVLRRRIDRATGDDPERGASAVEWVVISAIVVGIVLGVGALIYNALDTKAGNVSNCIAGASRAGGDCK